MSIFTIHTIDSAPTSSKPILEKAQQQLGFVPNLYGVLAESPAALKAYKTLGELYDSLSSFSATERQVVLLTTSYDNECHYCMAAHTTLAAMQKVSTEVVRAIREGEAIDDPRLESLRSFTLKVIRDRGWVSKEDTQTFLDAGFTRAQLLEVIVGVGMKTLSNYVNHISCIPLDEAFQPNAWTSPSPTHTCN